MLDINKVYTSNKHGDFKVVNYRSSSEVEIEFLATGYQCKVDASNIRRGTIKDLLTRTIVGVGFIGGLTHKTSINGVRTKEYTTWHNMLERCYSEKAQAIHPTYKGCTVCDEWHNFQNFAKWFLANNKDGLHLDKDIKTKGNKVYSPENCMFVSQVDNNNEAHSTNYTFTNPGGVNVAIYNLAEFCRDNNLTKGSMYRVNSGKRKSHKGWTKPYSQEEVA